ncbi:MAG TPA: hypothetical protein VK617_14365 [Gemmatimonadaceae bacterium]|jgi:hypothetical protein|nr:hypothetical protein [Gemmatimonadaceae bacterium]
MRLLPWAVVILAAASAVGCESSTRVTPEQQDAALAPSRSAAANAAPTGKPEIDPSYANGKTVYMIGPHTIVNARETMPNAYAHAEELYIVAYPQATLPQPGAGPITLPSGYQPQCDPCFHPGLPFPFVYHDHVLTGAPGMGKNGTAGVFKAPWKIIVLVYNPAYVASPTFRPITSATDLDAAEAAGNVFLPINAGGDNVYEVDTGNLLICPLVSSHA